LGPVNLIIVAGGSIYTTIGGNTKWGNRIDLILKDFVLKFVYKSMFYKTLDSNTLAFNHKYKLFVVIKSRKSKYLYLSKF